jgi:cytochrome b561
MDKFILILLGVGCIIFGFFTILERGYYSSKYELYVDFGEYHVAIGIFIILVGSLFIFTSLKKKNRS